MDARGADSDHGRARMDMSELKATPSPLPAAASEAQAHDDQHWSELLGQVFGDVGRHARSAVGVPVLPLDAPVEVELLVEV